MPIAMQCMYSFCKLRALNPLHIFTKHFILWSCYLGKIRQEFRVVVCHAKKRLKLSKFGRLCLLLNCFLFYKIAFKLSLETMWPKYSSSGRSNAQSFTLACKLVVCNYYSTQWRCCSCAAADHENIRISSKCMVVKYIQIGFKYLMHEPLQYCR